MERNATRAFLTALQQVLEQGTPVPSRNGGSTELIAHTVGIENPLERCYVIRHRNNNIFAALAETFWVLGGRNDLAFLSHYLPRAIDFSDDGVTWRGGYGPRLRAFPGTGDGAQVDQIREVVRLLCETPDTRRAVITIFDPCQDFTESRDIPCNNWLHFLLRDGRLHLTAAVRSNDVIWGLSGINTFEWSVLLEMVAFWVGAMPGTYTQTIGSLHIYDQHKSRAAKMLQQGLPKTPYDFGIQCPRFATPFAEFDAVMAQFFALETRMRANMVLRIRDEIQDPFLQASLHMLHLYNRVLQGAPTTEILSLVTTLPESDLRVAAIEYLTRARKGGPILAWDSLPLSSAEQAFFADYDGNGVL